MYFFGFTVPTKTKTSRKENFSLVTFAKICTYQIPIIFRPEPSFTPHQLSIHYRLERLHYYQHSGAHPLIQSLGNKNPTTHIQSTSSVFSLV